MESRVWDADEEDLPPVPASNTPLFPEALPPSPFQPHPQLSVLTTVAETTPSLMSMGADRSLLHMQASEQRFVHVLVHAHNIQTLCLVRSQTMAKNLSRGFYAVLASHALNLALLLFNIFVVCSQEHNNLIML